MNTKMPTRLPEGYPSRREARLTIKDGREIFLRPILPTDSPLILDLFGRLSPESLYLRFLKELHALPEDMLYRFTHIDYKSEFALVAVAGEEGRESIVAVARYVRDPREDLTDLAIVVRDDWQHQGLGKELLLRIADVGREHGIRSFAGMMDPHNTVIKQTLARLGFEVSYSLRDGFFQVEIVI
ncbi:MAG: Acetyltransferase Pat [Deltaproteobacteria bacterium ADurb.BinA179]|nr:MAG: Acetyltransferase Pat [Deltaproteobacteria bacterium ADurb.BinA179]HNR52044.1 GNAT family N-acetyltransferase [Deltaproteobacteria bacterium]HRR21143.1 GNAT family N-acetyltransferase [Desulfomonilia bacterium]HNU73704.1 GNAT family N-acetyltransferase [Deltaproteobacteria bacterium]HON60697.1 GNAT family N-acetyltransferase [Deltaproteobacteria bacterium]